jgi:hypothetical protein
MQYIFIELNGDPYIYLTNDEDNAKYQFIIYFKTQRIGLNESFVSSRFVLFRNRQPRYFWHAFFIWPENYSWSADLSDFLKRFGRIKILSQQVLDQINWTHTIAIFNNLEDPLPQEIYIPYEHLAKEIVDKNIRFIKEDVVEISDYTEMYPNAIKMYLEVEDLIMDQQRHIESSSAPSEIQQFNMSSQDQRDSVISTNFLLYLCI